MCLFFCVLSSHGSRGRRRENISPTQRDDMTMDPDTLLLLIRGPETGVAPVLGSPCVVEALWHSHAVGLRGAPYQTSTHAHEARNHGPCTVHRPRTEQATSCSVNARVVQRRVELAATRPLTSSVSPALRRVSLCGLLRLAQRSDRPFWQFPVARPSASSQ